MRHQKAGRTFGRKSSHRIAMFRNMTRALIEHERILTTLPKAKELRIFAERIITLAKRGDLHARRLVISRMGSVAKAELYDKDGEVTDDTFLTKLFNVIGPRFKDRPGGYTRIIKRAEVRLGDAGATAYIELLREGETKVKVKQPKAAPAPVLAPAPVQAAETTPEPQPAPEAQPQPAPGEETPK